MGILINDQIYQVIETKLNNIKDIKKENNLTDLNKNSICAYENILIYAKYVLENSVTPIVPSKILSNLQSNILNLHSQDVLNIDESSSTYSNIMADLSKIPVYNDKNITKAGIGKIIENFYHDKENIEDSISKEISSFRNFQEEEIEKWSKERENLENEINLLKKEKENLKEALNALSKTISSENTRLTDIILKFQSNYDAKMGEFQTSFEQIKAEMADDFNNFNGENKKRTDSLYAYMQGKQTEVERLWGIIGKASVSGNSQNYANRARKFAHTMTLLSLGIMGYAIWSLTDIAHDFFQTMTAEKTVQHNSIFLAVRCVLNFIMFIPAWYCASIANKQRNREFQLRDFEIKTAGLEPFIENMKMLNNGQGSKKDDTKLELVKDIFQNDLDKKKVDDGNIIIPKEIVKTIQSCLEMWGKIRHE